LNARELSVLAGTYPLPVKPDVVMCADGAGSIESIGPNVTRVQIGDRVAAAMFPRWLDGPVAWEYAPQIGGSLDGMRSDRGRSTDRSTSSDAFPIARRRST